MKKKNRATKKELYLREVDIIELIGKNKSRVQIGETLAEKWDARPSTILRQYDEVIKKMQEDLVKERQLLAIQLIERNNEIYSRCMNEGKYKTALDANNLIAKVAGLYREKDQGSADKPKFITVKEEDQSTPKLATLPKAENE